MTWEFAARLKGAGVTVNCLHPGIVNTNLFYTSYFSWQYIAAYAWKWIYGKVGVPL